MFRSQPRYDGAGWLGRCGGEPAIVLLGSLPFLSEIGNKSSAECDVLKWGRKCWDFEEERVEM